VKLFDGSSAVFVPQPPPGFEPWRYVNQLPGGGSGDIFAYTSTSDATGVAAVSRLSKSVSADQLQVTGGAGGATTVTYFLRKAPLS
jgi:hypothetical protein